MKEIRSWDRRQFLEFMGRSAAAGLTAHTLVGFLGTGASALAAKGTQGKEGSLPFQPIKPSTADDVTLASGFEYKVMIRWDDPINAREKFGFNNDYTAFFPIDKDNGLLWVNHEYTSGLFVSGVTDKTKKTREQVLKEQLTVGGSILRIKRDGRSGHWKVVRNDKHNRRITGRTEIPIVSDRPIMDKKVAIGTLSNCAGGKTPWGSVLTCEENYDSSYGEAVYAEDGTRTLTPSHYDGWELHFPYPPEHYGWVVEVEMKTGKAKKLTGIGRYAHECATFARSKNGKAVIYSGDDANDEFIYKFVSDSENSLEKGSLYVADTLNGRWLPLDITKDERLKQKFKDQTELLIRTREAARIVGATPQDRPEDIEIDPATGAVLVALTNNKKHDRPFGQILKIEEKGGDYGSMEFKATTFLAGGKEAGFACPDNMAFDPNGNLWFTSDISGSSIEKGPYEGFGNNGLFFVPMSGPEAGKVFQVAAAPKDAEFTGPTFSPDGRTLFLSVQHPGEESKGLDALTSHWPEGGKAIPRSAVITITGPALEKLAVPAKKA